jgi:hypothetical protein
MDQASERGVKLNGRGEKRMTKALGFEYGRVRTMSIQVKKNKESE